LTARLTLGQLELWEMNDARSALVQARAASAPQAERRGTALYLQGIALLAMEQPAAATAAFRRSREAGFKGSGANYAYAFAAQRKWAEAESLAGTPGSGTGNASIDSLDQRALLAADQGQWDVARAASAEATRAAMATEPLVLGTYERVRALGVDVLAEAAPRATLTARVAAEIQRVEASGRALDQQYASYRESALQALGYLAAQLEAVPLLERVVASVDARPGIAEYPVIAQMQVVLHAELDRLRGAPEQAMRRLRPLAGRDDGLLLAHAALARAAAAAGNHREALAQARWVASHRGRAYVERPGGDMLSAPEVAETTLALLSEAEAAHALGMAAESRNASDRFGAAWVAAELPPSVRARWVATRR
jgi:hypothetical protein